MEYNFKDIEQRWQQYWKEEKTYRVLNSSSKPKYYVLDMFPYPSGAGLHVGHPLGYIATDIFSRYKRLKGFNVLHPMGFDAFGLPAEQYAIQTGKHPGVFTEDNLATYRKQLNAIGFNYDWDREVRTNDPSYYKWTQWIFIQLFHSWYDKKAGKASSIESIVAQFETQGNAAVDAATDMVETFTAEAWKAMDEKAQQNVLMRYRLAYQSFTDVNWCEALGTVLANDEVKDGVSERGGYPVTRKPMRQWSLRITAYADRLLYGLDTIDWPESLKEQQRNWIGRSEGATVFFEFAVNADGAKYNIINKKPQLEIFTTRPDTIFGATFMVIAPEHTLVDDITTAAQKEEVEKYKDYAKNRSDRERQAEVKKVTGAFTGAYAINPFNGEKIPVYISDYVLMGYGTGAIMAVPSDDDRDNAFALHFGLPIIDVIDKSKYPGSTRHDKEGVMINSNFLDGMEVPEAITLMCAKIDEKGIGKAKVNYRMRDAGYSRQRYWGEPFPIVYKNDISYTVPESELPVTLPDVESYKPTGTGSPLATATDWVNYDGGKRETDTMPGYAGSSWYFLRYMDPENPTQFASKEALDYWQDVDLYVGGSEHAVGHLLYSRFWHKFLHDLGLVPTEEPFKKLVNQGMIQGVSKKVYYIDVVSIIEQKDIIIGHSNKLSPSLLNSVIVSFIESLSSNGGLQINRFNDFMLHYEAFKNGVATVDLPHNVEVPINKVYIDEPIMKFLTILNESDLAIKKLIKSTHAPIKKVEGQEISIPTLFDWRPETFASSIFLFEDTYLVTKSTEEHNKNSKDSPILIQRSKGTKKLMSTFDEVEKMSKRYDNVVNPDDIIEKYGADTFRLYEMFLGPLEMSKPWITSGIDGVAKFMRKFWKLYYTEDGKLKLTDGEATKAELKILHKTIKKIEDDVERLSFNTCVSGFMICINELTDLGCTNRIILKDLLVLLASFAPHIAEELWHKALGQTGSVTHADFPTFNSAHLVENSFNYPVSINGKVRANIELPLDLTQEQVSQEVLSTEAVKKWLEGKEPKRFIHVPGRIVNIVV